MAKKAASKGYSFGDLQDLVENISKKTSITIERDRDNESFISTGVYVMDALLSKSILKGGIPKNRITIFAGDPGTGKSYICYNIARNAQKEGYSVIYIDTEYSANNDTFRGFGIDVSEEKFMLISSNNVEAIRATLSQIISTLKQQKLEGNEIPKTLIILDSIGNLASSKEITDAIEGNNKQDMTRAKVLKSLFRIISSDLGFLQIPMVMTNHIYMCLTAGHEVLKSDGTYELIEKLKKGDIVKTLSGDKPIVESVEYKNCPIIQLTLENGQTIKCTPNHRFLVKSNWVNDENADCWKMAKELTNDDVILAVNNDIILTQKYKVSKVELLNEKESTYDIKVEGTRHYILKNGIISHNTMDLFPKAVMNGGKGAEYAASSIVYLTIAQLKTGQEDEMDLGSSGVVVTAKARKNRMAKPKKIKFEIDHSEGTNPYTGLDFWCTTENFEKIGIAKGKMIKDKDGTMVFEAGGQKSKWYVRHLDKTLFDKQLYNGTVFNKDILEALEPIIFDYFKYSSYEEIQQIQSELDLEYSKYEDGEEEDNTFDIDKGDIFDTN